MRAATFLRFAGVLLGLVLAYVLLLQLLPKPFEAGRIDGLYKKKEAAAARVQGPKVLIIGGSGTHYSYSARVVSEKTGLSVVNLGTHAGLGAEYILRRARASLKPGDTAVVALEYKLIRSVRPTTILSSFVLTSYPAYNFSAQPRDVLPILFGYPPVQVAREISRASVPSNTPLYRMEAVDAWGDETANTPANKLPHMLAAVRTGGPVEMTLPEPQHAPQFLVEFAAWTKANNVRLLQVWPVTTSYPVYQTHQYDLYFQQFADIFRGLGFTVLGQHTSYLLPEERMLDSMYHADTIGAGKVSAQLAEDLCRAIACPSMPAGNP